MAQGDPWKTASTIRSRNGISRATSLETARKHCAGEIDKGETVAAGETPEENRASRSPTLRRTKLLTSKWKTPADEENAGDWSRGTATARLQPMEKLRQKESKDVWNSQPGAESGQWQKLARIQPSRTCPLRESVSKSRDRSKVQNAVLWTEKPRGRRGNYGTAEHEQQTRPTCERRRYPIGGALLGQKLARSWRVLKGWRKRAPTRSRRPVPRVIWSGVCWEMLRNKKPLMAIHVLMMVVTYCRPGELSQSMREKAWCASTLCRAKYRDTTTRST